ncbi:multidrug effflux MFS transporter [Propionibacteriaceae bacterium Y2011]|uniref:multidrug effflux MFS transporter n=1 Tax=Microlunatus sp. Y2014 TaxID=3418488 RepID=UPI003B460AE4
MTTSGDQQTPERRSPTFGLTLVLACLAMFGPFSIDTVFPAFKAIGEQFGVGTVELQQITGVYLFSFAVMSLLHGPVSDAVGRKPVIIIGTLCYAAASVGCALSVNLPMLLVFRALQGMSAGSGQIISRAVVRDMFEGPVAQRLMAQIMMIFSVAPAVAPIIGGWLLVAGDWQVIFWFLAAFGVAMCLLTVLALKETHPPEDRTPLRLLSLVTGLVGVARHGAFVRLALAGSLGFAGQFLYIVSAPIFIVDLLGYGEQDFWIFFVPMIGGMVIGAFINARLAHRVTGLQLASVGFLIAIGAGVLNVVVSALPGAPLMPWAVLGPSLISFGIALCFPILQLAMLDLFPHSRGAAASMQSFVQLLLNAVLASVVAPLVTGTVLQLALTSLGFSLVGLVLWGWHRRSVLGPRNQLR